MIVEALLMYQFVLFISGHHATLFIISETGGICIAPCPAEPGAPILPAIAMRPFYGIGPVLLDEKGKQMTKPGSGALCISQPWPGMARTIYGDHQRFIDTYFKMFPG